MIYACTGFWTAEAFWSPFLQAINVPDFSIADILSTMRRGRVCDFYTIVSWSFLLEDCSKALANSIGFTAQVRESLIHSICMSTRLFIISISSLRLVHGV
jgi:hypothetical protein